MERTVSGKEIDEAKELEDKETYVRKGRRKRRGEVE